MSSSSSRFVLLIFSVAYVTITCHCDEKAETPEELEFIYSDWQTILDKQIKLMEDTQTASPADISNDSETREEEHEFTYSNWQAILEKQFQLIMEDTQETDLTAPSAAPNITEKITSSSANTPLVKSTDHFGSARRRSSEHLYILILGVFMGLFLLLLFGLIFLYMRCSHQRKIEEMVAEMVKV